MSLDNGNGCEGIERETRQQIQARHQREMDELNGLHAEQMAMAESGTTWGLQMQQLEEREELLERQRVEISAWDEMHEAQVLSSVAEEVISVTDSVPELITLEEDQEDIRHEANLYRRSCWKCGREVFIYYRGLYWCEYCLGEEAEEDDQYIEHLRADSHFGGAQYIDDLAYSFLDSGIYQNQHISELVSEVMNKVNLVVEQYREQPLENVVRGVVVSTNPFWDQDGCKLSKISSPFIRSVYEIDLLFERLNLLGVQEIFGEDVSDATEAIMTELTTWYMVLIQDSVRSFNMVLSGMCGCNEDDALVHHYCSLCLARLRPFGPNLPYVISLRDVGALRRQFLEDRIERTQLTLPGEDWDDYNRLVGQDDHGVAIERGASKPWVEHAGLEQCVVCMDEFNPIFMCSNGHFVCEDCVRGWAANNVGSCPVCREPMHLPI